MYKIMSTYDKDESGNIDFRQFLRMIFEKPYQNDTSEDLKKVFDDVDTNQKGFLDADDLIKLSQDLG